MKLNVNLFRLIISLLMLTITINPKVNRLRYIVIGKVSLKNLVATSMLFHDMKSLLYHEHWAENGKYFYIYCFFLFLYVVR